MKCIHCGKEIDETMWICPHCGQSTAPNTEAAAEPVSVPEKPEKKKKKVVVRVSAAPIVIGVALCLLGAVLMISGQISAGKRIKEMDDEYESRMEQQSARYEARIAELEAQLAALPAGGAAAAGAKARANVTHYPTNEVQSVGTSDRTLFLFELDGGVDSFTWEKRSSDGSWSELSFGADHMNYQYGLYLDEDTANGVTRLRAAGLTLEASGAYRCTASAGDAEAVAEVTLSVLQQVAPQVTVTDPETTAVPETTPDAAATPAPETSAAPDAGTDPAPETSAAPETTPAPSTWQDDDLVIISGDDEG